MLAAYNLINTVLFVMLAYLFICIFLNEPRKLKINSWIIIIIWIICEVAIVEIFDNNFPLKGSLTLLATITSSVVLFKDSKIKICILSIIQYILVAVFDFFAYMVAIKFTGYIHLFNVAENITLVYGGVISQLLYLLFITTLFVRFKNNNYKSLNPIELLKYSVFPLVSLSLIISFVYYSNGETLSTNEQKFYIFLAISILITNLYMFWLLKVDVDNKILIEKNKVQNEYAIELSALYNQITAEHQEISSIEHEYKNNLAIINTLTFSQKYDDLKTYLKNNQIIPVYTDVIDTGNTIASAVFNAKYAEASRRGIQVRFDINNLSGLRVKDTDLVIILSNILNNAIEACDKIPPEDERIIAVKMRCMSGLFFLSVTNTVLSTEICNTTVKTTKTDKTHHGFGTNNVKRIISTYDGQIESGIENELYYVRIIIPCDE